jgi:N6-adenosine-specific RNA methylase IME4
MTQEELKAIEIPAAENCVMFLWTTHKFIWDAKELLDAWGFEYRSMLVWDKQKIGMGNLIRMQCEFCLVGIKGKPVFKDNHSVRDLISEPRREHSRKPDAFYELVNDLCVGRKLDFFSREPREGWCSYGNDTEKFRMGA